MVSVVAPHHQCVANRSPHPRRPPVGKCLLFARDYVLDKYPNSRCVYGDTDSIFMSFHCVSGDGQMLHGLDAIRMSHDLCGKAAGEISRLLKWPHNLEPEKVAIHP